MESAVSVLVRILTSTAGAFATILALFIVAFWLMHWCTKKITEMNVRHQDRIKNLDKIDSAIDEIRRDIVYIKGTIDLFKFKDSDLAKSHSPLSLTDKGRQCTEELNADTIVSENWERIYNDLGKNISYKNAYDIQQYCIEIAAVEPSRFFVRFIQNQTICV